MTFPRRIFDIMTCIFKTQPKHHSNSINHGKLNKSYASNKSFTNSNPRVMSSNPRVRRLKTRVARLKAWVGRLKARVGAIKLRVR